MTNVLREKRIAAGYKSVKAFTKAIGVNNGTYWNWENGYGATTYAPKSALIAKKVCDAFDMSDAALKEAISNNYQARLAGKMEKAPRIDGYAFKRKKSTVLSDWRMKEQLTSNDVAELLGVSQRTYLDWENGIRKPIGDNLKNLMDLTGLSMHQIASMYIDDEPKQEVSSDEKIVEIEDPYGNIYEDILEPDPDEPEVIASPITPEEFATLNNEEVHEKMDEVITERDENGKPVAGRYSWQMTEEEAEALNEPHDFRDEVIDEVLEKMYGQMDYKKYVYLVGLLGR